MAPAQRRTSPGPSWAVLSGMWHEQRALTPTLTHAPHCLDHPTEHPSSSPSTRTSIRSYTDIDLDVDMGDDESEHEPDPLLLRAPISKRKAPAHESVSTRRPHKLPRLGLNGDTGTGRLSSASAPPSNRDPGHASRTQPAPPSTQKKNRMPSTLERLTALSRTQQTRDQSTSSGASTSDFPNTLSQTVQKAIARDKGKEKEKTREQNGATSSRRGPPMTARKQTAQAKNIHKVTTANLLKDAQKSSASFLVDDTFSY